MEAVASIQRVAIRRPLEGRPPEPTLSSWAGLEELRPELHAALARHARRHADLDDIVQEALLRAARYRSSLSDPARLRAWVIRIALNVLRDQMRRDLRLPRVDKADDVFDLLEGREEIPGDSPEDAALEAEGTLLEREVVLRHLDRALQDLTRVDRRVLGAFYSRTPGERRPGCVRETAQDLLKVQVFRARGRLARALRKRLALGTHADSLRPRTPSPNLRSARCAPVRPRHVKRDADCVAGTAT